MIKDNVLGAGAQRVVELDQQAITRLSRMDALQSQAMAPAQQRRADARLEALVQALRRIEEGEFGECIYCGDEIDVARLRANPVITHCMCCAQG